MVQAQRLAATRYCFIVRHGERADHASQTKAQYQGHPDAYLTPLGHTQATESGQFIKAEMQRIEQQEGRAFDAVYVKTSPFIRCMATCARICKQLGSQQVAIDYNFAEFLSDYLYSKNPIPKLELRNKPLGELNTEFDLQNIGFSDNE